MIVGLSGSGKSVLARRLGRACSLPVCHLDRYYWQPGWVEIDPKTFKEIHSALISQDQWIVEGNSMVTFDERVEAADTIIYLDFPRIPCRWRRFKRRFCYAEKERIDRPCGCKEKITWKLIRYVLWHFRINYHPHVAKCLTLAQKEGKDVRVIRSFKDVEIFLSQL